MRCSSAWDLHALRLSIRKETALTPPPLLLVQTGGVAIERFITCGWSALSEQHARMTTSSYGNSLRLNFLTALLYIQCARRLSFRRDRHRLGSPKRADISQNLTRFAQNSVSIVRFHSIAFPLTVPCLHHPGIPYSHMYGWEVGPCPYSPAARVVDYPAHTINVIFSHQSLIAPS